MEKEKRGTRIVTVWKEYYVKERLDDILPQLSELDFSQCHHSYAVNFRHVKELQRDMYILYGQSKKTAPQPWQAIAQRFCSIRFS